MSTNQHVVIITGQPHAYAALADLHAISLSAHEACVIIESSALTTLPASAIEQVTGTMPTVINHLDEIQLPPFNDQYITVINAPAVLVTKLALGIMDNSFYQLLALNAEHVTLQSLSDTDPWTYPVLQSHLRTLQSLGIVVRQGVTQTQEETPIAVAPPPPITQPQLMTQQPVSGPAEPQTAMPEPQPAAPMPHLNTMATAMPPTPAPVPETPTQPTITAPPMPQPQPPAPVVNETPPPTPAREPVTSPDSAVSITPIPHPSTAPGQLTHNHHVLVTAGPTQESPDGSQYLTQKCNGAFGLELAKAAHQQGAKVTLICGPCSIDHLPKDIEVIHVVSAREMYDAVMHTIPDQHIFLAAASVSERTYAPRKPSASNGHADHSQSALIKTPDIVACAARSYPNLLTIGFYADISQDVERAKQQLKNKHLDYLFVESSEHFDDQLPNQNRTGFMIDHAGRTQRYTPQSTETMAYHVVNEVCQHHQEALSVG